ncbi:DNA adenine methylase [Oceanicella sp. SM1341]|uniref:DNA adenine methylase n=1 Tax=Oceanicella sp. SM1341 TaxID=1548889 RepID=UPI000E46C9D5|nr:DNA adenine methylase [Oceanicella sp. SM1341]
MEQVRAAAPVAPWLGGKRALHRTLIDRISRIPHKTYVEPFVGMGGVFLRRPFRPRLEVANDRNGEIVNLFRILQRHYAYLMDTMRFHVTAREEFERLRRTDPATLTDLERAARFLYLQRLAFGGNIGGAFGVAPTCGPRFDISRLGPLLEAAHSRLSGVVFESLDWREVLARYDSPDTLFYLDPPYLGGENDYGKGMFARADFAEMAGLLAGLKGRFVMSINDTAETRDWFGRFHLDGVSLSYTAGRGAAVDAAELVVADRAVERDLFG